MALKGINEITNILNEYLAKFDLIAVFDDEFAYYSGWNEIHYTVAVENKADILFQNFAHELRPEVTCDTFLLSLYHEIGHHETVDELTDAQIRMCREKKAFIDIVGHFNIEAAHNRYFRMLDERMATEWGLDYIINHSDEVKKLWLKLQPAIMQFYKLNNVELN